MAVLNTTPETCPNLIDAETISTIRDAILIGLDSFGEIERLTDKAETLKMLGHKLDEGMWPLHPTGSADTVSRFVAALRGLDFLARMQGEACSESGATPT